MTRILSQYTNKDIKNGWKFIADSSLHLIPKNKVLDQREIDIYVRTGYRKEKIQQLILESVNEFVSIGRHRVGNIMGRLREFKRHAHDISDMEFKKLRDLEFS